MIDENKANKIVFDYLSKRGVTSVSRKVEIEELFVADSSITEYGFIFLIGSQTYLETQDINDYLLGVGPIIILKDNGKVIELGTAEVPEIAIRQLS